MRQYRFHDPRGDRNTLFPASISESSSVVRVEFGDGQVWRPGLGTFKPTTARKVSPKKGDR